MEWTSVKDRLPELGVNVLVYFPWDGGDFTISKLIERDGLFLWAKNHNEGIFFVNDNPNTHWMSLDAPYKDK